ncbi:multidrug transporter [Pontibacter sp. HSC-14F20]|uniref:multidrug transporter n=1 Tax=Pontibacter sp. HSC-14F20 TaxID=2864136 RepID=UPI001C73AEF2|nr:multidrug transporter [Pontibacter sp. HSC-14F20]MBX0332197.1 multidrug transporter [Pontibacter sp. HSC-14F20]
MLLTSTSPATTPFLLFPENVLRKLSIIIFVLLLADIAGIILDSVLRYDSRLTRILMYYFNFNGESNIPAFFSSVMLLAASGLLFLTHRQHKSAAKVSYTWHWFILGCIFLFMAIDENTQIHERVADFVRPHLVTDLSGMLHWAWVVPYGVLTLAVVAYFLRFVLRLPTYTRNLILLSGALFVTGALGLEFFEGYLYKLYGIDHLYNRILYCLEELMEMSGVALFIYALLDNLARYGTQIVIAPKDSEA